MQLNNMKPHSGNMKSVRSNSLISELTLPTTAWSMVSHKFLLRCSKICILIIVDCLGIFERTFIRCKSCSKLLNLGRADLDVTCFLCNLGNQLGLALLSGFDVPAQIL